MWRWVRKGGVKAKRVGPFGLTRIPRSEIDRIVVEAPELRRGRCRRAASSLDWDLDHDQASGVPLQSMAKANLDEARDTGNSTMKRPAGERQDPLLSRPTSVIGWLVPLLAIIGVLVYGNSLAGPFVLDHSNAIVENERIRQVWPLWEALSPPPQTPVAGRPVVNLSLAVNYALGTGQTRKGRYAN